MSNSLIIRQANKQEYEDMIDLQWKVLFESLGQSKKRVRKRILENQNDAYFFIGLIGSTIEGAARLKKENENQGIVEFLAIKDDSEINRVGPSILNFIEWYARGLKLNKIKVFVNEQYESALENCKYNKTGKTDHEREDSSHIIWQKEL